MTHNKDLSDWQTIPTFVKNHPQFTMHQMRWLLHHRKTNGLSECVRKLGKPLYISVARFTRWVDGHPIR